MKKLKMIIVALLIISILIMIGYAIYKYVIPYTLPIVFYAYFGIGFIMQLFGLFILLRDLKSERTIKDVILKSLPKKKKKTLAKLRVYISIILTLLIQLFVWPIDLIYGFINPKKNNVSVKQHLSQINSVVKDQWYSIYSLLILSVAYLLSLTNLKSYGYGEVFLYLFVFWLLLKHILYIVDIAGLPKKLRRLSSNPFGLFIIILIVDFISLVFVFTLLTSTTPSHKITFAEIEVVINNLYKFRQFSTLFRGAQLSLNEILMSISGLMFYLAFIKNIFKIKEFKRNEEDIKWLVVKNNLEGKYISALRLLKNVESKNQELLYQEVVSLLGVNDIEGAKEKLKEIKSELSTEEYYELYVRIFGLCLFYNYDITILEELISEAIIMDFPDALMFDSILVINVSEEYYYRMIELFKDFFETYPLTVAGLFSAVKNYKEALSILNKINTDNNIDQIIKNIQILRVKMELCDSDEEVDNLVNDWMSNSFASFKASLNIIEKKFEQIVAYGQIATLEFFLSLTEHGRIQEISYLREKIRANFKDDKNALNVFTSVDSRMLNFNK